MVLYPDVQHRAQNELDTVLGKDRLPTFEDRTLLPFIDALVLEVFRWNVVTPLGMISHFFPVSNRSLEPKDFLTWSLRMMNILATISRKERQCSETCGM